MTARVLIADSMSPRAAEILQGLDGVEVDVATPSPEELLEIIGQYDGLLVRSRTRVTAEVIAKADRLKAVGRAGIGVDNIDIPAATARGIVVMNAPFGNNITTAEHAIAMIMAVSRHIPQATAAMREGRWDKKKFMGRQVHGKTAGVVGLGNIGKLVAARLMALGARVIAYDPFITAERCRDMGAEKVELDELFARSDYITCHVPLNEHTRHLLDGEAFASMKRGVFIINCARGGIVDEAALLQALEEGIVGGAALDVFETEPPQTDHPLRHHDKVILTPHLGASTLEAQEAVAEQIAEQLGALLTEGTVTNALNAASVSGAELEALRPFVRLGGHLGSLAGQIHSSAIERVEIHYFGSLSDRDCGPITARVLANLFRHGVEEGVNDVNARHVARARGIEVATVAAGEHRDYTNAIRVKVFGGPGTEVSGAVYDGSQERVLRIDRYRLEMVPGGHALLVVNNDQPGIIGVVGSSLGALGINVSRLAMGLSDEGIALQVWSIDKQVSAQTAADLRKVEGIQRVTRLSL